MAKLDVTVTGINEVVFEGKRFEKVNGPAQKGDLARVDNPWGSQELGRFYLVINEDHHLFRNDADTMVYIDGERIQASHDIEAVTLFRETKEAKQVVKVGDKIRITEAWMSKGYKDGDVLTVNKVVSALDFVTAEETGSIAILLKEFEIVEQPKFKTEKRPAKVGERILIVNAAPVYGQTHKDGDVLTVTGTHACASDDVTVAEQQESFIDSSEYEVIVGGLAGSEKVPYTPKNGDIVRVLDRGSAMYLKNGDVGTVAELDSETKQFRVITDTARIVNWVSADKVELVTKAEDVAPKVKVGDHVKATKDNSRGSSYNTGWSVCGQGLVKIGTVGKVVEVLLNGSVAVKFDSSVKGPTNKERFVLAEGEFEVTEAPEPTFSVGDFVVVTQDNHEHREGDVLELMHKNTSAFDFGIRNLTTGRTSGYISMKYIRKATESEVEATKPKPTPKQGKFQPGDIVLATSSRKPYYAEVIEFRGGPLGGGNYVIDTGNERILVLGRNITMIAPKGNRVD